MSYYNIESKLTIFDLSSDLLKNYGSEKPVVVCLGSSKVLSDMVGVIVADILRSRNVDVIIFGGSKRNADKNMAKLIAKSLDKSRILFVDSGALSQKDSIMFASKLVLNDGAVIHSPCIVAGTITKQDSKYNFANIKLEEIKNYATVIADSICSYFAYVDLLKTKPA